MRKSGSHLYVHGSGPTRIYDTNLAVIDTLPLGGDDDLFRYDHSAGVAAQAAHGVLCVSANDHWKKRHHFAYGYKGRRFPNQHSFHMGRGASWFALGFGTQVRFYDSVGKFIASGNAGSEIYGFCRDRGDANELLVCTTSRLVTLNTSWLPTDQASFA